MIGSALCYVRKSLVRLASDEISPARQRAAVAAEAERHNWTARLFEDARGHSSGRNENRPGWIDLKGHLDDPGVKAVIVESLSRASRSMRDLFVFIGELEKRGIALISLKENIDATTATGRAFLSVIATLNQFESDIASERMKATIAFKRETRLQHWGYVPFGCARASDQKLTPTQEGIWRSGTHIIAGRAGHAPFAPGVLAQWFGYTDAVRASFEIYAESDIGFVNLADRLNRLGYRYRDRNGVPREFHTDDARRIIENVDTYAGHSMRRGNAARGADRVVRDTHAPIVARELCERVAEKCNARKAQWGCGRRSHAKRVYIVANAYCAECGAHYVGDQKGGIRYYRHSQQEKRACTQPRFVLADELDRAVLDQLTESPRGSGFTAPAEMKARIAHKARALAKQTATPAVDAARRVVAETPGKLERLTSLFVDGQISQPEYKRRREKIEQGAREAERMVRASPANPGALEELIAQVDRIADIIRRGAPEHQRAVLNTLFARHEVLGRKLVKTVVHEWARPFFNGACNERGEKV